MLETALISKINAALHIISIDSGATDDAPLFTATLYDLDITFESMVSGAEAGNASGAAPMFLQKVSTQ